MILRPYQEEAVANVAAGWAEASRQLAVLPTGSGKTIILARIAADLAGAGTRTLILAHREELIDQAVDKIARSTGIRAGIEKAERRASADAPVVVGSVQTLVGDDRRARWARDHFGLVICDEAHHAISASWQRVLGHFNAKVLGVTATADRSDKRNLSSYFERLAIEVSLVDLIRAGYLCPISIRSIPLSIDLSSVHRSNGDLDAGELDHVLDPWLPEIARRVTEHAAGRRILAFLPLIATSKRFVEAARAEGLRAEHIDGIDGERTKKLSDYDCGDFDLLSNAMLLTEGYDCPGIDCVLVLRPTQSRPLYQQMIGRGTRIDPLKDDLLVLDLLWLHEKHAICRPASLIAQNEEEAAAMTQQTLSGGGGDLIVLQQSVRAQREDRLRRKLEENSKREARFISAEEFASRHHQLGIAEFEPVFPWERQDVTDKQAKVLHRARVDLSTVRGRGHASKIIDVILGEWNMKLCNAAQRLFLRRIGHPSPETATCGEFRRTVAKYKQKNPGLVAPD
jgi:superfamily II DNA or RNA helicase